MSDAVLFEDVSSGPLQRVSFRIAVGGSTLVTASRPEETLAVMHLINGLILPESGTVTVLDTNPGSLSNADLYRFRREMGIVPPEGGLISNLKMWENITLPVLYTEGHVPPAVEERVTDLLKGFGYEGNLLAMPAHLSLYEKTVAAFIRATLLQPRIMVYCDCLDGIPEPQRATLLAAFAEYAAASADLTSIFLASTADAERHYRCERTITIGSPTGNDPCA